MKNPIKLIQKRHRVKAQTVLQYEAAECGAASLATILRYHGKYVPLAKLREECGVNRDGSNAKSLLIAARNHGLQTRGYRCDGRQLAVEGNFPCIVFWGFNHFLVVEGFDKKYAFLSDPMQGRIRVLIDEFLDKFTGVVLEFSPGPEFEKGGKDPSPLWLLPSLLRGYRKQIIRLFAIASGLLIPNLMVAGLTSSFISDFLEDSRLYFGIPILWLMLISAILWIILLSIQYVVLRRVELLLSKRLTADLFEKLFSVPWAFFQTRMDGELSSRMLLGMTTTQVLVAQLLRFLVTSWSALLIMLVASLISFWLTLLVVIILGLNLILNWWLTVNRYDANRKLAIEQGKAQGRSLQGINNIETLKASGLEFDFLSQWQGNFGSLVEQNQLLGAQMAWSTISASGASMLLSSLVLTVGGLLIIGGKLSLGVLISFQFLQAQLVAPISNLPQLSATLQRLIGDLGRLIDLTSTKNDSYIHSFDLFDSQGEDNTDYKLEKLSGEISLKNLSFGFNTIDPPFIEPINLQIKSGSHIALVGPSGSGKTTLIRLISGLMPPTQGEILFDGQIWNKKTDQKMRHSIAYVPQQVFVFNATIWDNITLWNPEYQLDDLVKAAKEAELLDIINNHPEAFLRQLNDNGSDLSGGERQRLELCRALIRQPAILLLDEATSSLDNLTQQRVLNTVCSKGSTVVSVAHRLDAALVSDEVWVMSQGKIIERGNPKELLKNSSGAFSKLLEAEQRGHQEVEL